MNYKIAYDPNAERDLDKIAPNTAYRIYTTINSLSENPRPNQCIKLQGRKNQYRIRIGNYRVIYTIDDPDTSIRIIHIKNRKDVYR